MVAVADASKVGRRAFARICSIDRIDTLISDVGLSDADAAAFTEAGVQVVRV